MSVHIPLEELADAAAGVLDGKRVESVQAHLGSCAACRDSWTALHEVTDRLANDPAPTMPADVAQRLTQALAEESRQRAAQAQVPPAPHPAPYLHPTLGPFGADLSRPRWAKYALPAVAACVAAGVVGFAGYFISARAGLNEPPTSVAVVNSKQLGAQAQSVLIQSDPGPHRFSQAWQCARQVTSGRITAISTANVDGEPALLVYTTTDGADLVTVVTGCSSDTPQAGPSTTLPR
ncbi:MAG: zf-HC2 domain-containing protein [Propionibacteriaceae bacterium]